MLGNRLILVETHIPREINVSRINLFLRYWFFVGGKFCLISVCFRWLISEIVVMNPWLENTNTKKEYYGGSSSSTSNVYVTRLIDASQQI